MGAFPRLVFTQQLSANRAANEGFLALETKLEATPLSIACWTVSQDCPLLPFRKCDDLQRDNFIYF